jgi:enoyl-CoA hydratase
VITTARHGAVALVEIDRQDRRNALDTEHCHALTAALTGAVDDGARAVVLTGAGSAFCAGADLDGVHSPEFLTTLRTLTELGVPVLAAVNGPAIGAGTQLALAADLRVVGPTARFGLPTAQLGLAVDPWTLRRLALVAGGGAARRVVLACEQVTAVQVPELADRLGDLEVAMDWAAQVAVLAPMTLAYSKRVLNQVLEPDLALGAHAVEHEAAFRACFASEDFAEGRAARTEKRTPVFRGR